MSSIQVILNGVSRSETGHSLNMTAAKGHETESLEVAVSEETAIALETILKAEPFISTKLGTYNYEVQEINAGPGFPKTLTLQISKGRARTKRSVVVEKDLFLVVWNIFHFQELPSRIPSPRTK